MAGYAVLLVIGLSGAYYVQHRSIKEKYGEDVNVREEVRDPFKGLYVEKDSAGHFYLPTTE